MQTFKGGADDAIFHNITRNILCGVWVTLIHVQAFRYNLKTAHNENFTYTKEGINGYCMYSLLSSGT